jgi:hypothetical protein
MQARPTQRQLKQDLGYALGQLKKYQKLKEVARPCDINFVNTLIAHAENQVEYLKSVIITAT